MNLENEPMKIFGKKGWFDRLVPMEAGYYMTSRMMPF